MIITTIMEVKIILIFSQCLILATLYVLSLYVWKSKHNRDHPAIIKRRFISVFVVNLISPLYLWLCLDSTVLEKNTLWELMGIRLEGLPEAACFPLILTTIFFLGPLAMDLDKESFKAYFTINYWVSNFKDFLWLRNIIVGPLSEEVTYRACMIPLLSQCFSPIAVVFICPIFFGAAHFNHFMELVKSGWEWQKAFYLSSFQFLYTTVFGAYSTFLLLRTGHLISSIFAHVFCNLMGVPNLPEAIMYEGMKKYLILILWVCGIVAWIFLVIPLTEPALYYNNIYWKMKSNDSIISN